MLKWISVLLVCLSNALALAQEPQEPVYNFQNWKEQQILEAQNQVLRVSARIAQLKTSKTGGAKDSSPIPTNGKIKKVENDVNAAEKDLRRAQESLRASNELTIEDYATIYLPSLRDSAQALQNLAQKLSKEELAEIFKVLVQRDANEREPTSKRNKLNENLSASVRPSL